MVAPQIRPSMENKLSSSRRRGGGFFKGGGGLGGASTAKAGQGRGGSGRQSDSSILRGAEIIRQQIRKQLEEEDAFRKSRQVRDTLLEGSLSGSGNSSKQTRSFSSDDDHDEDEDHSTLFSDPWMDNNNAPKGARRTAPGGDSSTVLREASHSVCSGNSAGLGMSDWSAAASVSASSRRIGGVEDLSPPPPPPPPDDYDDGECYTPLSTIRRENAQQRGGGVRILKVTRRGSSGLSEDDNASDDGTYGFVGEDYDSELELDDQGNSGAVDSYLPTSLRNKGCKSWSPIAVSKVDSSTTPLSPFMPGIVPRRLHSPSSSDPPEPSISVKAKAPSKAEASAALHEPTCDELPEQSSQRHSLAFWSRLSSGGRSKLPRNRPSPQPSGHRLISPTASEKTDRLELSLNQRRGRAASDLVPSPLSVEYEMMLHDPAFCHAKDAGLLWQSLVGQQVRFPTTWWNGARGPPMGLVTVDDATCLAADARWEYFGRSNVARSRHLNRLVPNRAKPGRLLLHMVVLDDGLPVADVAVGAYHPNARGVRAGDDSNRELDRMRTLWIAMRKRAASCTLLELPHMQDLFPERTKTPLDNRKRITNQNMRAVYGEQAPLETLFVPQQELELRLVRPDPILALVREFVFD